jgi:hypothetical protein
VSIRFITTLAGSARLSLIRNGHIVAGSGRPVRRGQTARIGVRRRLTAGIYDARVVVSGRHGVAGAGVGVAVGPLSLPTAKRLAPYLESDPQDPEYITGPCRRFTALRIDCQHRSASATGNVECDQIVSVSIDSSGLPARRYYGRSGGDCGGFRIRPQFSTNVEDFWPPFNQLGVQPAPALPFAARARAF